MYDRLLKILPESQASIMLLGPRGTGKTMWVQKLFPKAIYIDLLNFNLYKTLSAEPTRLEKIIPENFTDWIVVDEVQKIPELLNEIHRLIEQFRYKFLLTGSSARKLRRKGVNLLAGRALRYNMHPMTIQELGDDFILDNVLKYGLLPAIFSHENPEKYLATYVEAYLREEVLQEGLTRNISAFSHFLEVASFSQGAMVNAAEIAREVGVSRQVICDYFTILEDLLIAYRLPPFTRRAKRRMMQHNKFYFFDVGVYNTLRPKGPIDSIAEIEGIALETLFLQSLLAINDYLSLGYKAYFWRTSGGLEVDFVLYGEKGLLAFEIKRTANVASKALKGLKAFGEDYPEAKLYLLYMGDRREYHGNINVIPVIDALRELPEMLQRQSLIPENEQ